MKDTEIIHENEEMKKLDAYGENVDIITGKINTEKNESKEKTKSDKSHKTEKLIENHLDKMGGDYLKCLMNFLQILTIFNTFGFNYNIVDSSINQTMQFLSGSFFSVFSFDCLLQNFTKNPPSIFLKALVSTLIPVILTILSVIFTRDKNKLDRVLVTVSISMFLFQPNIVQSLFDILNCTHISNVAYIYSEMKVVCYTDEYNEWIAFLVIPSLLIYVVVLPAYFFRKILIGNYRKKTEKNFDFMTKVGFLIHGFKKDFHYWENILLWEKIILIILAIFWGDLYSKAVLAIVFLMLMGYVEYNYKPLLTIKLNDLELNRHISLIVILLMRTFKLNNSSTYFQVLTTLLILLVQFQFFFQSGKYFVFIKLHSYKKIMRKCLWKFIKAIQSCCRLKQEEIKKEFSEYMENFEDLPLCSTQIISSNLNTPYIKNKTKKTIIDFRGAQHNAEIIKMLYKEIKTLKKIVEDLTQENERLKKGKCTELYESSYPNEVSSPTSAGKFIKHKETEILQSHTKIEESSKTSNYITLSVKWPLFRQSIIENIENFSIKIHKKYINLKSSFEEGKEILKIGKNFVLLKFEILQSEVSDINITASESKFK